MPAKRFKGNLKRCGGCSRVWPLSVKYWHRRPSRPLGFSSRCRECRNEDTVAWREQHPDYKPDPARVAASLRRRADRLEALLAQSVVAALD